VSMKMEIHGPAGPSPRPAAAAMRITPTVFAPSLPANRCRAGPTRGARSSSEVTLERERHDKLTRSILNQGKQFP